MLVLLLCTRLGFLRCASCWTRFLGGGPREHYLRDSRGVSWITQKSVFRFRWRWSDSGGIMLYMLVLVGQPSLRGRDACKVFRAREHPEEIADKIFIRPLFLLFFFFC